MSNPQTKILPEANKKYRLITRSDMDGLVCGVILKELGLVDDITFAHPKDMQDGLIEVGQFKNGLLQSGRKIFPDGGFGHGSFKDGKLREGRIIWPSGEMQSGIFQNGILKKGQSMSSDGGMKSGIFNGGK